MPSQMRASSSDSPVLNREAEERSDPLLPSSEHSSSSEGSVVGPPEVRSSPLEDVSDDYLSRESALRSRFLSLGSLGASRLDSSEVGKLRKLLLGKGKELSELREDEGSELPDSREECFIGILYT